ncbi:carboxyl transferase domain-containing protein [Cryptosporangium aurantiacum]|uniref:Acetyl-coenzyme A carboxylase carboxyl transferase subunits beta/alpha n=1 Tax=Cryptosporangium aurantiacum TaxID=134849 RepID=A0A1M7KP19_9ACTN|nr:carboxyl transferase domain-containing protein [Cryptosporangium aurantiacum]SHM67203.1 acetyl-CoA carboxylase carboxyl transferase subunit beta [Cryptosporangium aurantiacum]
MTAEIAPAAEAVPFVEEWDAELCSADPLDFPAYESPAAADESVRTGVVDLAGTPAALVACRFDRHGGTMGVVAGERIVRAFRRATERRLPVVELVASGGARLQEGMFSLVQMGRTASAVADHAAAGLISAAVLRSPTTGGVYASWASLADVRAAEPSATIGFGGPRVVAQVTGSYPPATSHTAESAHAHGLVDALVPRSDQWGWLTSAVGAAPAPPLAVPHGRPTVRRHTEADVAGAWAAVTRARAAHRASGLEWAAWLTDGWLELRGTDPGVRAGIATLDGGRVLVIAMDRHANPHPGPAAFRLAQRAIRLAGRLGLPVLTLVDTPGADPSPPSEADGVAAEIARTLLALAELRTASVGLVVGEGGSGGALALAHTDRLLLLRGAVFSVIGPEAGAAVLYRDAARAPELAASFRLTAGELARAGLVDAVLDEDAAAVRAAVTSALGAARPGDRTARPTRATASALAR